MAALDAEKVPRLTSDEFRRAVAFAAQAPETHWNRRGWRARADLLHQRRRDEDAAALAESLSGPLTADEALEIGRRSATFARASRGRCASCGAATGRSRTASTCMA
jgi:hypothetical protein